MNQREQFDAYEQEVAKQAAALQGETFGFKSQTRQTIARRREAAKKARSNQKRLQQARDVA